MNFLTSLQERLGLKIFLSYLVIVIVGSVVFLGTAQIQTPAALNRHVARMQETLGDDPVLAADLNTNFQSAISEILVISVVVSLLAAVAVSVFTARRIIGPIQVMREASGHIAAGDYHERISVTSTDELGALAEDFNQMASELELTEQRRLDLIGDVAHELRTPLSSIRSTMEGLVDDVLPGDAGTYLGVQREVSRLQQLVQDLEELSRVESGQIDIELEPTDLGALIYSVINKLEPQYLDKDVSLEVKLAEDVTSVWVDAGRFTQLLLNLLGNALQYTSAGGKVIVLTRKRDQEAVLEVSDTGIGISEENLTHIFERFYRVDKSRSRASGGSGIGLTIAKHLVEAQGGQIWAESPGLDQGTTFSFTLPLVS